MLVAEESALSLTLSNFFMDTLQDTANKACIGLADGGKHLGKNTGAELLAKLQKLRVSHLQQKKSPCMKGYLTSTEENI